MRNITTRAPNVVAVRSQSRWIRVPPASVGSSVAITRLPGVQKLLSTAVHRTVSKSDQS
ncbi:MAG: hypothetical protein ABJC60_07840 [Actinomycetota bacterium]